MDRTSVSFVVVVGPTAVGKSEFGMYLAERLGGEIVNADAFQVYRGLDIGTGTPSAADRERTPHHLVDILDPCEQYSAGEFGERAHDAFAGIHNRDRVPIVVGGSGLYVKALLEGLAPIPAVDDELREYLGDVADEGGLDRLRRMLRVLDPETAAATATADRHRTLRGIEVALSSGRAQSRWVERQPAANVARRALCIGLTLPRALLYDRIEARAAAMFDAGWIEEVERLESEGIEPTAPGFRAIGYRDISRHLRGEIDGDELREGVVVSTRRLAKRQMSWFRAQPEVIWLDAARPRECAERVQHLYTTIWRDHGEERDQHPGRVPVPESQGGASARR